VGDDDGGGGGGVWVLYGELTVFTSPISFTDCCFEENILSEARGGGISIQFRGTGGLGSIGPSSFEESPVSLARCHFNGNVLNSTVVFSLLNDLI
jgi:hypothetical protein